MLASNTPPNDATFKALKVILVKSGIKKNETRKLELLRRNNTHDCLHLWYRALSSAVRSSASSAIRIHPLDTDNYKSRKRHRESK
uniref:Uncharacterized protein n=1 Tax=Arundo donax TaxID=35708 RepID=A0A0A9FRU1_ARUDO